MTAENSAIRRIFQQIYDVILEVEDELAQLDSVAGDGDHGAGMVRGFNAVLQADLSGTIPESLQMAGKAFSNAAGGSSGALIGMFIMRFASQLSADQIDAPQVAKALQAGLDAICKLGKAKVGDKTMVDTLAPFVEAYVSAAEDSSSVSAVWTEAVPSAEAGMESTRHMISSRGRASKLGERSLGHVDPGARSMYYLIVAVDRALRKGPKLKAAE